MSAVEKKHGPSLAESHSVAALLGLCEKTKLRK